MGIASPAPAPSRGLRGHCAPPALAELIRDLYLEERSGTLIIGRSGVEKQVILDRGMILAATSSLDDERLPAWLAARGLILPDEAEALRRLDDRRVAEAVAKRGGVSAETLAGAVRELALQVLTAVFRWSELDYQFVEGAPDPWPFSTDAVQSFEMIIRALRSMAGFEPVRDAVLRQERAVRLADDQYLPFDRLSLSAVEGYLLSRIDGRTRPRDILAQVPPSEEDSGARFLFGLLILGLAQFHPPLGPGMLSCDHLLKGDEEKRRREENELAQVHACYKAARTGDHAALLGVQAGATKEQIRAAYEAKKECFDSGRFLRRVRTEMKEELLIIEASLLEAFLALRGGAIEARAAADGKKQQLNIGNLAMRKEMNKTRNQAEEQERVRLAEVYLAKAREYWKLGDIYSCMRYCELSRDHNEGVAAVHALLGQALSRNRDHRWQKRAEASFVRATEVEPFNPTYWVALGEFYRTNRLHSKARHQYEKALRLQPGHTQALEALKALPPARD
jgi:tetratricopeptide (TPR) repeat protein